MNTTHRHCKFKGLFFFVITGVLLGLLLAPAFGEITREYYADYVEGADGLPKGIFPLSPEQVARRGAHWRFESEDGKLRRVVFAAAGGAILSKMNDEHFDRTEIQEFVYSDAGDLVETVLRTTSGPVSVLASYGWNNDHTRIHIKTFREKAVPLSASFAAVNYALFNFANKPSDRSKRTAAISGFQLTRDARGYIVRKMFLQQQDGDAFTPDTDGVFGIQYERDEMGRILELKYLKEDGTPGVNKVGVAGVRYEYGACGRVVKTTYFGKDGNPAWNGKNYAIKTCITDPLGNVTEVTYANPEGKPCEMYHREAMVSDGYAKAQIVLDEQGNAIEYNFYRADGTPTRDGACKFTVEYDQWGNPTKRLLHDEDGEIFYGWEERFDEAGNRIEMAHYGHGGKLVKWSDSVDAAGWTSKYDKNGHEIERAFYGVDGKPSTVGGGVAKWTREYDENGNLIKKTDYDLDGNPIEGK